MSNSTPSPSPQSKPLLPELMDDIPSVLGPLPFYDALCVTHSTIDSLISLIPTNTPRIDKALAPFTFTRDVISAIIREAGHP